MPLTARSDANPCSAAKTHGLNQNHRSYIGRVLLEIIMVVDLRLRHAANLKDSVGVSNTPVQTSAAQAMMA